MAKERLKFSDVEHIRCPNCNYRVPVESAYAKFKRDVQERRNPGHSRREAMLRAQMFSAAVREAKSKARRKRSGVSNG